MISKEVEANKIGRVVTAMVTPFNRHGELDVDGAKKLASHLVEHGSKSIVVSGTTGESPTLTDGERMILLNAVLDAVDGRGKVIAGTSTYSTEHSVELARLADTEGADGQLWVTPYYNKPSQGGLVAHFGALAEAVPDSPAIIYNVPSRTNVNIKPETDLLLDREFDNIVGLKEAVGTANEEGQRQVALIIEGKTPGFQVWSGNDQDTIQIMNQGGFGIVSVGSHLVGDLIDRMVEHQVVGEKEAAAELHKHLMPLFEHLFPPTSPEPSPSAVKAMLNIVGLPAGGLRLPVLSVPAWYNEKLQVLLATYNLVSQQAPVK